MFKQALGVALAGILFLLIVSGLAFYFGFLDNSLLATVGLQHTNIERHNFEHSQAFTKGKADDLVKFQQQYDEAKTDEDKARIKEYIKEEFSELDPNTINNPQLRTFLLQMMGE